MKKIFTAAVVIAALLAGGHAKSQNIKSEDISYYYFRLPSQPLKGINNYQATIVAPFEAKNKQLLEEYETQKALAAEKYKQEMISYKKDVQEAENKYERDLAEYNKKSTGTKFLEKKILEENNKPVKQLPSHPYETTVPKPTVQKTYDYNMLASTYLTLDGFQNEAANALKIMVTLYGYDFTQPRTVSEQSQPNSPTYYRTEFSYRHPMSVKVAMPDGKEILSITPPALNLYKNSKTSLSSAGAQVNGEAMVKTTEEQLMQDNLLYISNLLNDRYAFSKVKRIAKLYYVKNKQEEYGDLTNAFNEASAALPMIQQDSAMAKEKLQKAIDIWANALKESDVANKKARIDKDVTIMVCFNLLEAAFASSNLESGKATLNKLNTVSLSSDERKIKNDYELLFADLKKRKLLNN